MDYLPSLEIYNHYSFVLQCTILTASWTFLDGLVDQGLEFACALDVCPNTCQDSQLDQASMARIPIQVIQYNRWVMMDAQDIIHIT